MYSLEFVRELLSSVPTSANIRQYATIVKDKSILRNIIKVNEKIANDCYAGKDSTEDILAETEKRIFELVRNKGASDYTPIDKVVLEDILQNALSPFDLLASQVVAELGSVICYHGLA